MAQQFLRLGVLSLAQTNQAQIANAVCIARAQCQNQLQFFFGQCGVALFQCLQGGIARHLGRVLGPLLHALLGLLQGGQALHHGRIARKKTQEALR